MKILFYIFEFIDKNLYCKFVKEKWLSDFCVKFYE